MSKCYMCGEEITSINESEEHIIPNSCGGRLKSKKILCSSCNNLCGSESDKCLGEQIAPLMQILGLQRERGKTPPVKVELSDSHTKLIFRDGNIIPLPTKPILPSAENGFHVTIQAASEEEACKIAKTICNYPLLKENNWTTEKIMDRAEWKKIATDEFIHFNFTFGGRALPSIIRILTSFYAYKNGPHQYIKQMLPYIKGELHPDIIVPCYCKRYIPANDEISHVIKIIGNPAQKLLWGYIELFNCYKMALQMSDDYIGEYIDFSYIYDLKNRKEIDKKIDINFSKNEIENLHKSKKDNKKEIIECFQNLIIKTNHNNLIKRFDSNSIIEDAVKEAFGQYPQNEPLPPEAFNKLEDILLRKLAIYFCKIKPPKSF